VFGEVLDGRNAHLCDFGRGEPVRAQHDCPVRLAGAGYIRLRAHSITVASIRVVRDTATFIRHTHELRLRPVARTRLSAGTE